MTPGPHHARRRAVAVAAALALAGAALVAACTTTYEFDDLGVGDESGGRTPVPRSSAQFVGAIYADLLGRTPEVADFTITQGGAELARIPLDEQALAVGAMDAVGDPRPVRDLVVTAMLASPEAGVPARADVDDPAAFVTDQFRLLLGREPNTYELGAFVTAWRDDPAVTPRTVIRAIVASREYQSR
ncbi:MAG: hypothetical protein H6709_05155 [Kofleriaceae bacterium]|nr:hypothetical protein [Myxococcales bacterium]MCB9559848.1 hypothetical protein [Kofleriaceae bacterium]MCB9571460.1 hypothetical protein [Kofleriaceae bacterium]